MTDKQITCAGCGRPFTWSAGEQRFFAERGLQRPRRCNTCRKARPLSPYLFFGAATLLGSLGLGGALLALDVPALLSWLIAVNAVAFLTYGYDKMVAGRFLRSPERVLLGLALAGGSAGALLGMLLFRHKVGRDTADFRAWFWRIVALQVVLSVAWLALWARGLA